MAKRRGRPPGPNYARNQAKLLKTLQNKGLAQVQATAEKEVNPAPQSFVSEISRSSLLMNFFKAVKQINGPQKYLEAIQGKPKNPEYYDEMQRYADQNGAMFRPPWRIRYEDLRTVALNSSLVGAIHQLRADDARLHTKYNKDLGFQFKLEDEEQEISEKDKATFKDRGKLVTMMGDRTVSDWRDRERFDDVIEMATRDVLAIDKVSYMLTRNRKGRLIDIRYLDPATIFKIDPKKGYKGDKRITHVQAIDWKVTETFESGRILLKNRSAISDMRFRGEGFSPTESCVYEVMGTIYALKRNLDKFNGRSPPNVILTSKNKVNYEVQELFEQIWDANYSGDRMHFRPPLIHGIEGFDVHKLDVDNDMLFEKFMQWTASMILARHGVDEAEIGLKMQQGQSLSEPSLEGRARLSRNRSHGAVMRFHEKCYNEILEEEEEAEPTVFYFTGVTLEDKDQVLEHDIKKLSNFMSPDEIRAKHDLPNVKELVEQYELFKDDPELLKKVAALGGMVQNQHFATAYQQLLSGGEMGGGEGEFGGEPTGPDDPDVDDRLQDEIVPDEEFADIDFDDDETGNEPEENQDGQEPEENEER